MGANDKQVGGEHYKKQYQHWDMVVDTKMPYLLGCATKYPSRWRDKNGVEDLRKSLHYIEKAKEVRTDFQTNLGPLKYFCEQLNPEDAKIVRLIGVCCFAEATKLIQDLIDEAEAGPTPNYVDPDKNYIRG